MKTSKNKNNKILMNLFTNAKSYFKKSADVISLRTGCSTTDIVEFRNTKWYKEHRKNYCS